MISKDIFKDAFKTLIMSEDPAEQKAALTVLRPMAPSKKVISLSRNKVKSVKKLADAKDEYVYDIGMKNESHPWFFGNNILVHNSVYFSAYPILKDEIESGAIDWSNDAVIKLYDQIGEEVNATFPQFMLDAFNCPKSRGTVIKSGREIVADHGLFIKKKRYAVRYFDKDGDRYDVNGKKGKLKAMGLDLKRADTPTYMQDFLTNVLNDLLDGKSEREILDDIMAFRMEFKAKPGWEKGSPRRANSIGSYAERLANKEKVTLPGQVRGSMNWNTLRRIHNDVHAMTIVDGAKVIVCQLRPNQYGFSSVAYPVDEPHLPDWFKELPFDDAAMESIIIDKKIENLLGVLEFDLDSTKQNNTFHSLFTFN